MSDHRKIATASEYEADTRHCTSSRHFHGTSDILGSLQMQSAKLLPKKFSAVPPTCAVKSHQVHSPDPGISPTESNNSVYLIEILRSDHPKRFMCGTSRTSTVQKSHLVFESSGVLLNRFRKYLTGGIRSWLLGYMAVVNTGF